MNADLIGYFKDLNGDKVRVTFESAQNSTVTATPEKVIFNGVSGNFWEFYGHDKLRNMNNVRLCRTFMADKSTRKQIIEQFEMMS